MDTQSLPKALRQIRKMSASWPPPAVVEIAREGDPFQILIACIISLRTRDAVTREASRRLFQLASRPAEMLALPLRTIEQAIYPAAFYRAKARNLVALCRELEARFGGAVPDSLEELLSLKGVGRKTANLVVSLAFGKPGICVDTHVHRICNRWGYVATDHPDATEKALRRILPRRYWISFNTLLVGFGQNCCVPVSPHCSQCPVAQWCDRVGVTRHR